MNRFLIGISLFGVLIVSAHASAAPLTPAQLQKGAAEEAIQKSPKNAEAYNDLALAFIHRVRETSDSKYYRQAEEALGNSLRIAPENFAGQKLRVQILIGKHEFVNALELARTLNKRVPDDIEGYGLVADAAIDLGDYHEAEDAAQWMLNLRPPTASSLMPPARLRELFGDVEGALEFLNSAVRMTGSRDPEGRARILVQIARLSLATGKVEAAGKTFQQALVSFPDYHPALAGLAQVLSAQQKHSEAIELWRRECEALPHPRNFYGLANALDQAGLREQAAVAYGDFEKSARSRISSADNANRELIFFYSGSAEKPEEALRLAREEISRRHDVYTRDAYAWALYANGQFGEARREIEMALATGIRDSDLLYHAGAIHFELHEPALAADYWRQSLALNPLSLPARKALAQVSASAELTTR